MPIVKNCNSCIFADEMPKGFVLCDCDDSPHYMERIPNTSWCKCWEDG